MILTKCPHCGKPISSTGVCAHCGYAGKAITSKLSQCPACGNQIADSATCCPHCGYTEITPSKRARYHTYALVQKILTWAGIAFGLLGSIGAIIVGAQLSGTVDTSVQAATIVSGVVDAIYPALILIGLGTILGAVQED